MNQAHMQTEFDRVCLYLIQNFEPKVMVFQFMKFTIVYSEN